MDSREIVGRFLEEPSERLFRNNLAEMAMAHGFQVHPELETSYGDVDFLLCQEDSSRLILVNTCCDSLSQAGWQSMCNRLAGARMDVMASQRLQPQDYKDLSAYIVTIYEPPSKMRALAALNDVRLLNPEEFETALQGVEIPESEQLAQIRYLARLANMAVYNVLTDPRNI